MFAQEWHPSFQKPIAPSTIVWRYMDLARLLSILEDQTLTFTSAALMADTWEGSYAEPNLPFVSRATEDPATGVMVTREMNRSYMQRTTFMSCWHVASAESAAMWDIYQRDGRGVAIRTTWGRLTSSLQGTKSIHGGRVKYIDYRTHKIPPRTWFDPYLYKRLSFRHEREARLMFIDDFGINSVDYDIFVHMGGYDPTSPVVPVPVDVDRMIQRLYIAPKADEWFVELLTKVRARYGYSFKFFHSDLDRGPII